MPSTQINIDELVQMICRQTDYTEEVAREKLAEYEQNHIAVIKAYLGIAEKKAPQVKSVNQEMYKQMRHKLDDDMRDYNSRKERGETKIV